MSRGSKGWTPERRMRQAERIRHWKPWEHSTGAKSQEGKAIVSQNALKHGHYSTELAELRKALKAHSKLLRDLSE